MTLGAAIAATGVIFVGYVVWSYTPDQTVTSESANSSISASVFIPHAAKGLALGWDKAIRILVGMPTVLL